MRGVRGLRVVVALVAAALLSAGCAGAMDELRQLLGLDGDDVATEQIDGVDAVGTDDVDGASAAAGAGEQLECEREGFPCTWGEVSGDRLLASLEVSEELVQTAQAGWDPRALAESLADTEGVVDAAVGADALFFRLEGARPMWVFSDDALVSDGPTDELAMGPVAGATVSAGDGSSGAGAGPPRATAASMTGPPRATAPSMAGPPRATAASMAGPMEPWPTERDRTPAVTPAAVVGDDPSSKSALVLAVYDWQPLFWGAREVAEILEGTRGYAGNVELLANPDPGFEGDQLELDPDAVPEDGGDADDGDIDIHDAPDALRSGGRVIGPEHFTGWDAYDVVFLATHGLQLCEEDGRCWTALSLGSPIIDAPMDRSPEQILAAFNYADTPGVTLARRGPEVLAVLEGDWLAAQYDGRLEDTLVFVQACASARAGDLAAGLSGERSVFLGWSRTVYGRHAGPAAIRFFQEAAERGVTSITSYDEVVADGLHVSQGSHMIPQGFAPGDIAYRVDEDGLFQPEEPPQRERVVNAELVHSAPGTDLRIREVIELQDPDSGAMLVDGAEVAVSRTADGAGGAGGGNGARELPVRVEVDGVLDGEVGAFDIELVANGVTVGEWNLAEGELVAEETWRIEDAVTLTEDLAADGELTLDAITTLPEGGTSQYVVDVVIPDLELYLDAYLEIDMHGVFLE